MEHDERLGRRDVCPYVRQPGPLLDEIARILNENLWLLKVEIQGHTDNVGDEAMNMKLSQSRAESVMHYLTGKKVGPARLVARGYGLTSPIAGNSTARGRATNRRVEFVILESERVLVDDEGTVVDEPAGGDDGVSRETGAREETERELEQMMEQRGGPR